MKNKYNILKETEYNLDSLCKGQSHLLKVKNFVFLDG